MDKLGSLDGITMQEKSTKGKIFEYSRTWKWFSRGSWAFFAIAAIYCLVMPSIYDSEFRVGGGLFLFLLCIPFIWLSVYMVKQVQSYVEVDDNDISLIVYNGRRTTLPWSQISNIVYKLGQRTLKLISKDSGESITVRCAIADFVDLHALILERTKDNCHRGA